MATPRNKQVGSIEYKPMGIKVPLVFDSAERVFRATYATTPYQNESARELETTVLQAIKASVTVSWQAVIEISPIAKHIFNSALQDRMIGFELQRCFVAQIADLGYKTVHWSCPEAERITACRRFEWSEASDGPFQPPARRLYHGQVTQFLAYTDELWEQLLEIEQYFKLAAAESRQAFSSPEQVTATLGLCRMLFDRFATQDEEEPR